MIITVKGRVFSGLGEGEKFTTLPWVKRQIKEKLGFEPHPGTLNLSLSSEPKTSDLPSKFKGWEIRPEKGYFTGRLYKALIMGKVVGAVVRPDIPTYPDDVLEIIAPNSLRKELHLKDGDEVEVIIWLE